MQLHQLKSKTKFRKGKRVGRGDKTAGRGTKGQKSRAGAKIRPAIRDIIKKLPKKRGYRFRSFRPRPEVLDLERLQKHFGSGDVIDAAALLKKGLIRRIKGRIPEIKILGSRVLKKRFVFRGLGFSRAARQSVIESGGTVH